jgi:hypothetical protein
MIFIEYERNLAEGIPAEGPTGSPFRRERLFIWWHTFVGALSAALFFMIK